MSFNIGENVGPYRIIEQLGQGGMATVYKAYHAALDRYVALKVLHPAFHQDQTFTGRFQREARVVARLEHPNIVPIYDYSEHEARPYLVMKYIEGDTLKARFSAGPLSSAEIEKVVSSVGSALAYAHKQGIWHRDIKPSNVLLANDGVMYLADFGLARIAEAGESTLSSDSIMGTPQYISPEQAMGSKDLDAGTDIYSFGVMLYEMVVGQVPFSADTPFSIIHDHIYTPLPLPMDINPKVPEPVQRVLMKALAKQRADRYESVDEMCNAFRAAWNEAGVPMQGTGITMRPGSLKKAAASTAPEAANAGGTVVSKGPKKQRSAWQWIAAGLLVILCVAAVVVGISSRRLFNRGPVSTRTPAVTAPVIVPENTSIVVPSPLPNSTVEGGTSAEVTAALEEVANDPANPDAHLNLSLAYWNIGEKRPSMEELAQAANLAGPTNREFFLKAAEEYKSREAWIPAAGMYLRLVAAYSGDELPVDVENDFHEAVYKASEQKEMPLFVFFERIDSANLPLGYIARSRYALFNGKLENANEQLNNAAKAKPDMYEVFLLRSEIAIKSGDPESAKATLLSLSADLGAPEWIRFFANNLLLTIE
jgi:tRNA A-37 threonylcarbamoyl transferase component Bud32